MTILLLLTYGICIGQTNLVPNWSFEIIDSCNFGLNCSGGLTSGLAPPWDSPTGTSSDLYNSCSTHPFCRVPSNYDGYQNAHTGNGYVGIICYAQNTNYREYIQTPLDSTLISQHKYCVSFYVTLGSWLALSTNNIGMYFSPTHTHIQTNYGLTFTPQINQTTVVGDTTNWTEITGTYIANGGEQYIIIGNFFPDSLTDTIASPSQYWG